MKIRINESPANQGDGESQSPGWRFMIKLVAAAMVVLLIGLVINSVRRPPPPPGTILFEGANVVMVPGPGWNEIRSGGYMQMRNLAPPVLEGNAQFKGSMIEVLASSDFPKRPEEMASNLVSSLRADKSVVPESIRQENFTADSGLGGIHIWCLIRVQDLDRVGTALAHSYVVTNGKGQCVRINYTTAPDRDSEAVHQMIRKTLAAW